MSHDQLARIEARLDRIEAALDVVTRDVPNAVGTATDAFDDWARAHADLDERLERLSALVERATRPATMQRLQGALDTVDRLEGLAATAGDVFDAWAASHSDLDKRVAGTLEVFERLSRPQTLKSVTFALDQIEELPKLAAFFGDAFDDLARQARAQGLPVGTLVEDLSNLIAALLRVAPKIHELLESGMLEGGALDTLGRVARATSSLAHREPAPLGLFGAMRALSDPEVQRSIGFAVELARGFGSTTHPTHALAKSNGVHR